MADSLNDTLCTQLDIYMTETFVVMIGDGLAVGIRK
jgi:hypothetical protein